MSDEDMSVGCPSCREVIGHAVNCELFFDWFGDGTGGEPAMSFQDWLYERGRRGKTRLERFLVHQRRALMHAE